MERSADCGQADVDDGTVNEGETRSQDGSGENKHRIFRLRTALCRSCDADITSRVDRRTHPTPRLNIRPNRAADLMYLGLVIVTSGTF
jgi:hypothetical protein